MMLDPETPGVGDEIRPYKIRVSSRYLDLTRQKLELTRLPHESTEPKSADWWEPKPQVEPLIDYWLEKYSWRDHETAFNESLPQFRTSVTLSAFEKPVRLHFIHVTSPHATAVPLLLIPPFPLTNLSLGHLVKPLTDPEDPAINQPFHLVIPSLPGLGFSDPLPNNTPIIFTIADVLNTLMGRLCYPHYLASNSGAASQSPAEIDWKLVNTLATRYSDSCLGTHFISPPLTTPKIQEAPWEWTKWNIASFFRAGILGYDDTDFKALDRTQTSWSLSNSKRPPTPQQFGLTKLGLREPNTLAYALCDSPIGLLVFVMKGLRAMSPQSNFTPDQVITFTELAWLPGPEYAMRFWAYCATHDEEDERRQKEKKAAVQVVKPRVAITVFLGGKDSKTGNGVNAGDVELTALPPPVPMDEKPKYSCPAWANARYNVLHTQRVVGKPGLLAWERPEVVVNGVRGLAREIIRLDKRIAPASAAVTTRAADSEPVPLQKVVVIPADDSGEAGSGGGPSTPANATSPVSDVDATPRLTVPSRPGLAPTPSGQKDSDQTVVSTSNKDVVNTAISGKGKEKELEVPKKPFEQGATPDTLVSKSPLATPSPIAV